MFCSVGSGFLNQWFYRRDVAQLRRVRSFDHILVIADLNIGDAVIAQAGIAALRAYCPLADIDFIVHKAAACLIDGNPDITNLYPIFNHAPLPEVEDLHHLFQLCEENPYDLIVTYSPFLRKRKLGKIKQPVLDCAFMETTLVGNQKFPNRLNHVCWQMYHGIHSLLGDFMTHASYELFQGVTVTISPEAISQAHAFLRRHALSGERPLVLYNPDTSSPCTRMPLDDQKYLLQGLLRTEAQVLLGEGHTVPHIADCLLNSLSGRLCQKATVIPAAMSFDAYAVFIDTCDAFITGDSGALHAAAAWKRAKDGRHPFRNRTAVYAVFGATPARMYGYDSLQPGFLPAHQHAPSRTYIAKSPCRNITCIHKMGKTCQSMRCFERMTTAQIVEDIDHDLHFNAL